MRSNIFTLEFFAHLAMAFCLLIALPMVLDPFWMGNLGKYIAFAFVAIGVVLAWGYCGILSLGQGIFFGIGGYAMAMFLKLEASAPNLPDFMEWSSVDVLPLSCQSLWHSPSRMPFSENVSQVFTLRSSPFLWQ
jgi:urea transport system permease protein